MTSQHELFEIEFQKIEYADGIDLTEAKLIAQNLLIENDETKYYDFENPEEFTDLEKVKKAENYWFIAFREGAKTSIKTKYLIAIHKLSGKVVFSRVHHADSQWALEAFFLNLDFMGK